MQMFAAHKRFGPACGHSWTNYIQWSGLRHLSELISTDEMLCPSIVEELTDEDWRHNIHADFKTYFFHDFEYLKRRIGYDPSKHNLLSLIERPNCSTIAESSFEFCGYDILDSYDSVSVLTNCGGFPSIFRASEVNRYGLLDDLSRALGIAAQLRAAEAEDPHCGDCRVWSLCRYVGSA
jgi:hypothetical protein